MLSANGCQRLLGYGSAAAHLRKPRPSAFQAQFTVAGCRRTEPDAPSSCINRRAASPMSLHACLRWLPGRGLVQREHQQPTRGRDHAVAVQQAGNRLPRAAQPRRAWPGHDCGAQRPRHAPPDQTWGSREKQGQSARKAATGVRRRFFGGAGFPSRWRRLRYARHDLGC